MKKNPGLWLTIIILVAVAAGIFVYPKSFGAKYEPWKLGLDLVGGAHLVYQVDLSKVDPANRDSVVAGLRDVIEKRVNSFGVSEPQVYSAQSGATTQLIIDLAGVKSVSEAIQQIGETPLLQFEEVDQNPSSTQPYIPTNLTGEYLTGAQLVPNQTTGAPEIDFSFNDTGAKIFDQMTKANTGKPLCVFLDGTFLLPNDPLSSCPTVSGEIPSGKAVITGKFTFDLAKQIVERFNAGALPAPITLITQQTVSPTLGGDSLQKMILAGLIGTILVMLFMLLYYRTFGIFASLALIIYTALTLAIFKLIPITLSLSGLAGFILTIGMAVDANILIFERIKEEMKRGLPRASAIEEGFKRAWLSIRDSNTSTIITAIILYFFTSSFVQGFALTLLIGVVVSLFSAITTTRLFLRFFMGHA